MKKCDELKDIYKDVSEWLKFAEGKNIAAIAILAILATFISIAKLSDFYLCILIIEILMLCLILIFNLTPFTNMFNDKILEYAQKVSKSQPENVVFYASVYCINIEGKYRDILLTKFGVNEFSPIEEDYIQQIIAVSNVAVIKYYSFNIFVTVSKIILLLDMAILILA